MGPDTKDIRRREFTKTAAVAGVSLLTAFFGGGCKADKPTPPATKKPTPTASVAKPDYSKGITGYGLIDPGTSSLLSSMLREERAPIGYNDYHQNDVRIIQRLLNTHRDITGQPPLETKSGVCGNKTMKAFQQYAFKRMGGERILEHANSNIGASTICRMLLDKLEKEVKDPATLQLVNDCNFLIDATVGRNNLLIRQQFPAGTTEANEYGLRVAALQRVLNHFPNIPQEIPVAPNRVAEWGDITSGKLARVKNALGIKDKSNGDTLVRDDIVRITAALICQQAPMYSFAKPLEAKAPQLMADSSRLAPLP